MRKETTIAILIALALFSGVAAIVVNNPAGSGGGDAGGTNSRQFGTTSLTNLSGGTNLGNFRVTGATFFQDDVTVSVGSLGAVGGVTWGPGLSALVDDGSMYVDGNMYGFGWFTNKLGFTNGSGMQVNGTLNAKSNLVVRAGQSTSNAWVGGLVFSSTANFTNLNNVPGTLTNLGNIPIPANMLTNNGDFVSACWGGLGAHAMQNTQNFQIVYGSIVVLDTGLQISSNVLFRACIEITRTDNTSQHVEAKFEWLPNLLGATGVPWTSTNRNIEVNQTNGIDTLLALRGSAQRVGAHTNNAFRVSYQPAVR